MTFSTDLTEARLLLRNSATDPARGAGDPIVNAAGEDLTSAYGDFDMTMTTEGSAATITVTGPFAPETDLCRDSSRSPAARPAPSRPRPTTSSSTTRIPG